jgi:hypothetical protein
VEVFSNPSECCDELEAISNKFFATSFEQRQERRENSSLDEEGGVGARNFSEEEESIAEVSLRMMRLRPLGRRRATGEWGARRN